MLVPQPGQENCGIAKMVRLDRRAAQLRFSASFTALFVYTFYVAGEILEQAEEDNGLLCNLSHIQRLDTEFGSLDLDDFDAVARYICEMLFLCAGENLEAGDVDHFANAASGLNGAHREEFYKIVRQGIEEIHRVLHERKGKDPLETAILAHDLMGGTVAGATAIIVMYHDPDGSVAKMIQTYSLIGEKGQPKDRTQKSGDYDVEAILPALDIVRLGLYYTMQWLQLLGFVTACISAASSTTVADIQGTSFKSPLNGQTVSNVTGVVTAKWSSGFFIAGETSTDVRASNGLSIYTTSTSTQAKVQVGDLVSLSGKVAEYRSSSSYLYQTEISSPTNITVLSSNNSFTPVILGVDRSPPTQQLTSLDSGPDGYLSVPNNVTLLETVNPTLQPALYGLDFWESLEGQLVTIPKPVAIGFPNSYGEFWVHGAWKVTGKNSRGGLSITIGPDGKPDANPEAVMIGAPSTDFLIENMAPDSAHLPTVANHIATYLNTPDIVFLQEIQDNSGPTDDGTVIGNLTLTNLVNAIANVSSVKYNFLEIAPTDDTDGGEPGGNIRQAYLYRPEKLTLVPGAPAGTALDKVEVLVPKNKKPTLNYNPGRIDPTNAAWSASRKPLVAQWQTKNGKVLFTINVHLTSKGGSSPNWGDARPPVNLPVDQRAAQISLVAAFAQTILKADNQANIMVAGDFNEYIQTRQVFKPLTDVLTEADAAAGVPDVERYTYVYDQNSEQLDHVFFSDAVVKRGVKIEHIHVNNWSPTLAQR
ncbi:hypothetical protein H0H93_011329, partial [Arthromyces matolae]